LEDWRRLEQGRRKGNDARGFGSVCFNRFDG
jgi:hypothetical protein